MALSKTEFTRLFGEYLARYDRKLRLAFIQGMNAIRDDITLRQLVDLWESGRISEAVNLVDQKRVGAAMANFTAELTAAVAAGGSLAATASGTSIQFNITDNRVATFVRDYRAVRVQQITDDLRDTIGRIVYESASQGVNGLTAARNIKSGLGLTPKQYQAVQNYRGYLENLQSEALHRELRDKRFDRTLQNAIDSNKPLSKEKVDQMVSAYERKYINYRAQTIGRTESTRLLTEGQQKYWQQAVEDGLVPEYAIRREWIYTHDTKTRQAHRSIPGMNPGGVGLNEPFKSPLGLIMRPGDPNAAAANSVNCRCTVFNRVLSNEVL